MLKLLKRDEIAGVYLNLVKKIALKKASLFKDEILLEKRDFKKTYMYLHDIFTTSRYSTFKKLLLIEPDSFDSTLTLNSQGFVFNVGEIKLRKFYSTIVDKEEFKEIVMQMGIKTCPYCNRNFIEVVIRRDGSRRRTSQIDHFLGKDTYPIYAISFYNLIPVCPSCNHHKSTKTLERNPYLLDENDMKFSIKLLRSDYYNEQSFRIVLLGKTQDALMLDLEEIYQLHKNIVEMLIIKKRIYTRSIIDQLLKQLHLLGYNEDRIRSIVFGVDQKAVFLEEPLSKLKHDILNLLGKV
jgi:transposase-like protein